MIDYDQDIALLKRKIYHLRQYSDEEVDSLYSKYCRDKWRAGWVEVWSGDDRIFREFEDWVRMEEEND